MENKKLNDNELEQVDGGFIPPLPPSRSAGEESPFQRIYDGSEKAVRLNIDQQQDPQDYDCSGVVS